jgi:hypothetical protein
MAQLANGISIRRAEVAVVDAGGQPREVEFRGKDEITVFG